MSTSSRPAVPDGLRDLMKDLTREILKEKPIDIYEFAANYFQARLPQKEDYAVKDFEKNTKQYDFSYIQNPQRYQVPVALVYSIIPEGLTNLIKDLIKAILREQPQNLCDFAAEYFRHLKTATQAMETKEISYKAYDNYFTNKERFLFTPYVKCTCGRTFGEGLGSIYQLDHLSTIHDVHRNDSSHNKETITTRLDDTNNNHVKVVQKKDLIDSEKYINSIYVIQRYFRRYLKRTKTNKLSTPNHLSTSNNLMNEETAAIIIQRTFKKVFGGINKVKKEQLAAENDDTVSVVPQLQMNQNENDNISEAASYTSASTALLSASESGRETSEIGASENILQKTILEREEIENDYENISNFLTRTEIMPMEDTTHIDDNREEEGRLKQEETIFYNQELSASLGDHNTELNTVKDYLLESHNKEQVYQNEDIRGVKDDSLNNITSNDIKQYDEHQMENANHKVIQQHIQTGNSSETGFIQTELDKSHKKSTEENYQQKDEADMVIEQQKIDSANIDNDTHKSIIKLNQEIIDSCEEIQRKNLTNINDNDVNEYPVEEPLAMKTNVIKIPDDLIENINDKIKKPNLENKADVIDGCTETSHERPQISLEENEKLSATQSIADTKEHVQNIISKEKTNEPEVLNESQSGNNHIKSPNEIQDERDAVKGISNAEGENDNVNIFTERIINESAEFLLKSGPEQQNILDSSINEKDHVITSNEIPLESSISIQNEDLQADILPLDVEFNKQAEHDENKGKPVAEIDKLVINELQAKMPENKSSKINAIKDHTENSNEHEKEMDKQIFYINDESKLINKITEASDDHQNDFVDESNEIIKDQDERGTQNEKLIVVPNESTEIKTETNSLKNNLENESHQRNNVIDKITTLNESSFVATESNDDSKKINDDDNYKNETEDKQTNEFNKIRETYNENPVTDILKSQDEFPNETQTEYRKEQDNITELTKEADENDSNFDSNQVKHTSLGLAQQETKPLVNESKELQLLNIVDKHNPLNESPTEKNENDLVKTMEQQTDKNEENSNRKDANKNTKSLDGKITPHINDNKSIAIDKPTNEEELDKLNDDETHKQISIKEKQSNDEAITQLKDNKNNESASNEALEAEDLQPENNEYVSIEAMKTEELQSDNHEESCSHKEIYEKEKETNESTQDRTKLKTKTYNETDTSKNDNNNKSISKETTIIKGEELQPVNQTESDSHIKISMKAKDLDKANDDIPKLGTTTYLPLENQNESSQKQIYIKEMDPDKSIDDKSNLGTKTFREADNPMNDRNNKSDSNEVIKVEELQPDSERESDYENYMSVSNEASIVKAEGLQSDNLNKSDTDKNIYIKEIELDKSQGDKNNVETKTYREADSIKDDKNNKSSYNEDIKVEELQPDSQIEPDSHTKLGTTSYSEADNIKDDNNNKSDSNEVIKSEELQHDSQKVEDLNISNDDIIKLGATTCSEADTIKDDKNHKNVSKVATVIKTEKLQPDNQRESDSHTQIPNNLKAHDQSNDDLTKLGIITYSEADDKYNGTVSKEATAIKVPHNQNESDSDREERYIKEKEDENNKSVSNEADEMPPENRKESEFDKQIYIKEKELDKLNDDIIKLETTSYTEADNIKNDKNNKSGSNKGTAIKVDELPPDHQNESDSDKQIYIKEKNLAKSNDITKLGTICYSEANSIKDEENNKSVSNEADELPPKNQKEHDSDNQISMKAKDLHKPNDDLTTNYIETDNINDEKNNKSVSNESTTTKANELPPDNQNEPDFKKQIFVREKELDKSNEDITKLRTTTNSKADNIKDNKNNKSVYYEAIVLKADELPLDNRNNSDYQKETELENSNYEDIIKPTPASRKEAETSKDDNKSISKEVTIIKAAELPLHNENEIASAKTDSNAGDSIKQEQQHNLPVLDDSNLNKELKLPVKSHSNEDIDFKTENQEIPPDSNKEESQQEDQSKAQESKKLMHIPIQSHSNEIANIESIEPGENTNEYFVKDEFEKDKGGNIQAGTTICATKIDKQKITSNDNDSTEDEMSKSVHITSDQLEKLKNEPLNSCEENPLQQVNEVKAQVNDLNEGVVSTLPEMEIKKDILQGINNEESARTKTGIDESAAEHQNEVFLNSMQKKEAGTKFDNISHLPNEAVNSTQSEKLNIEDFQSNKGNPFESKEQENYECSATNPVGIRTENQDKLALINDKSSTEHKDKLEENKEKEMQNLNANTDIKKTEALIYRKDSIGKEKTTDTKDQRESDDENIELKDDIKQSNEKTIDYLGEEIQELNDAKVTMPSMLPDLIELGKSEGIHKTQHDINESKENSVRDIDEAVHMILTERLKELRIQNEENILGKDQRDKNTENGIKQNEPTESNVTSDNKSVIDNISDTLPTFDPEANGDASKSENYLSGNIGNSDQTGNLSRTRRSLNKMESAESLDKDKMKHVKSEDKMSPNEVDAESSVKKTELVNDQDSLELNSKISVDHVENLGNSDHTENVSRTRRSLNKMESAESLDKDKMKHVKSEDKMSPNEVDAESSVKKAELVNDEDSLELNSKISADHVENLGISDHTENLSKTRRSLNKMESAESLDKDKIKHVKSEDKMSPNEVDAESSMKIAELVNDQDSLELNSNICVDPVENLELYNDKTIANIVVSENEHDQGTSLHLIGNKSPETLIGNQNLTIGRIRNYNEGLIESISGQRFAETHLKSFWKEYQMNNSKPLDQYDCGGNEKVLTIKEHTLAEKDAGVPKQNLDMINLSIEKINKNEEILIKTENNCVNEVKNLKETSPVEKTNNENILECNKDANANYENTDHQNMERIPRYFHGSMPTASKDNLPDKRRTVKEPTSFTIPFEKSSKLKNYGKSSKIETCSLERTNNENNISESDETVNNKKNDLDNCVDVEPLLDSETPTKLFNELNEFDYDETHDIDMEITYTIDEILRLKTDQDSQKNSDEETEIATEQYSPIIIRLNATLESQPISNENDDNIIDENELSPTPESMLQTIIELSESETPRPDSKTMISHADLLQPNDEDYLTELEKISNGTSTSWTTGSKESEDYSFVSDEFLEDENYNQKNSTTTTTEPKIETQGGIYEYTKGKISEEVPADIKEYENLIKQAPTPPNNDPFHEDSIEKAANKIQRAYRVYLRRKTEASSGSNEYSNEITNGKRSLMMAVCTIQKAFRKYQLRKNQLNQKNSDHESIKSTGYSENNRAAIVIQKAFRLYLDHKSKSNNKQVSNDKKLGDLKGKAITDSLQLTENSKLEEFPKGEENLKNNIIETKQNSLQNDTVNEENLALNATDSQKNFKKSPIVAYNKNFVLNTESSPHEAFQNNGQIDINNENPRNLDSLSNESKANSDDNISVIMKQFKQAETIEIETVIHKTNDSTEHPDSIRNSSIESIQNLNENNEIKINTISENRNSEIATIENILAQTDANGKVKDIPNDTASSQELAASIIQKAFRSYLQIKNKPQELNVISNVITYFEPTAPKEDDLDSCYSSPLNRSRSYQTTEDQAARIIQKSLRKFIDHKSKLKLVNDDRTNQTTTWFVGDEPIITNESLLRSHSEISFDETEAYVELNNTPQHSVGLCSNLDKKDTNPTAPVSNRSCSVDLSNVNQTNLSEEIVSVVGTGIKAVQLMQKNQEKAGVPTNESSVLFSNDGKSLNQLPDINGETSVVLHQENLASYKKVEEGNLNNLISQFMYSERLYSDAVNQSNPSSHDRKKMPFKTTDITDILADFVDISDSIIPYTKLEEPCIKKTVSKSLIVSYSNGEELSTSSDVDNDTDVDSLSMKTVKLDEPEEAIEKMKQRRDSTTKISNLNKHKEYNFDEPQVEPIDNLDTDEDGIVVYKLKREETIESSVQSEEDVVIGDDSKTLEFLETIDFDTTFPPKGSLKRVHSITGNSDAKSLLKNVTIDEYIKYIEPPDIEVNSGSFCLDDATSQNIRRKMMAYSLSEADSDYLDKNINNLGNSSQESQNQKYDDFNVSTALVDNGDTSTETESTIVSAVTKIQAGARGYLTRKRLGRTSKSMAQDDNSKASFGNAAISESLEYLVQEAAAKRIQKVYRKHYRQKLTERNQHNESVPPELTTSMESSLAQKRSIMLQRGDALRNDSTPDEGNSSSNGSDDQKAKIKITEESKIKYISKQQSQAKSTAGSPTPLQAKITASAIRANKIEENKKRWLAMRQNSMPVQIDSEVLRVIPKHMRKKIKSAEAEKKRNGRRRVLKD